jgi:two-component system, OmpR family, sensor histidine kinase KdpD
MTLLSGFRYLPSRESRPVAAAMLRTAIVPVIIGVAVLLCDPWQSVNRPAFPFVFLFAVVASAWVAGRVVGLLGAILAALALDYFYLPPRQTLGIGPEAMPCFVPFLLSSFATDAGVFRGGGDRPSRDIPDAS